MCKFSLVSFVMVLCIFQVNTTKAQSASKIPVKMAVAGLTHGHAAFILDRAKMGSKDFELAGIYEPNTELAARLAKKYNIRTELLYTDLNTMLDDVKPEAVAAFGSIYEHMMVVEACAPRGIHVMVEKPLATNNAHATRMAELAEKYQIQILTNYETSWYPTTVKRDTSFP